MNDAIKFVSLCGDWVIERDWFSRCAATWHRLVGEQALHVMSDGGFTDDGKQKIESLSGLRVERFLVSEQIEREFARRYPILGGLREQSPLMRKLTDLHFYFDENAVLLFFDSDVFVRRFIRIPEALPDFAYCIDDVPGYTGKPTVAFSERMLRGLNSGFIILKMAALDLSFLEHVASHYLSKFRRLWWVEQTCWALIGGRLADVRIFTNESIEIVSGFRHRNEKMRQHGETNYLPWMHPICSQGDIQSRIMNTSVVHFAGPGKPWIKLAELDETNEVHELRMPTAPKMGFMEKGKLFARLALQR
jgi:hypothetical protein